MIVAGICACICHVCSWWELFCWRYFYLIMALDVLFLRILDVQVPVHDENSASCERFYIQSQKKWGSLAAAGHWHNWAAFYDTIIWNSISCAKYTVCLPNTGKTIFSEKVTFRCTVSIPIYFQSFSLSSWSLTNLNKLTFGVFERERNKDATKMSWKPLGWLWGSLHYVILPFI